MLPHVPAMWTFDGHLVVKIDISDKQLRYVSLQEHNSGKSESFCIWRWTTSGSKEGTKKKLEE